MHICSLFGIKKKAKWKFSEDKQGHQCCHKWYGFKGYITNPEYDVNIIGNRSKLHW